MSDAQRVMSSVVIGRRRHLVVPIRWRGIAPHNVVALFASLSDASTAARRLAALPSSVSAILLVPVDAGRSISVTVGVHTAQRDVADEAAVSLRRSGARRVVRFGADMPDVMPRSGGRQRFGPTWPPHPASR